MRAEQPAGLKAIQRAIRRAGDGAPRIAAEHLRVVGREP
jgi:hypothetical protein